MAWVYNCKERFGYTYLWTCNETMQNVLSAYCEGRSFLWNMFLGWRKTRRNKADNTEQAFFWIPSRKVDILIRLAKDCEKRA